MSKQTLSLHLGSHTLNYTKLFASALLQPSDCFERSISLYINTSLLHGEARAIKGLQKKTHELNDVLFKASKSPTDAVEYDLIYKEKQL